MLQYFVLIREYTVQSDPGMLYLGKCDLNFAALLEHSDRLRSVLPPGESRYNGGEAENEQTSVFFIVIMCIYYLLG